MHAYGVLVRLIYRAENKTEQEHPESGISQSKD